ncbi:MAG: histidine kinase dimerization/phosphoacceptor domain -containing protein [Crocinitomicaceae bacterium]|nr:histidine kinase dimerization/phosphoacceptor domain -containing protein [Crocinitomicaceae bacterium]
MANIYKYFGTTNDGFRPYYEKEDNFRRIVLIHCLGAFVISPLYTWLVYQYANVSDYYLYLGLSYTVFFPIYITICWFIKWMRNRLIYLIIFHYFIITYIAFVSLYYSDFAVNEIFCFLALFSIGVVVIQRLYPFLLYTIFVFLLLLYGFKNSSNIFISEIFILGLFVTISGSALLVLLARMKLMNAVEDYTDYLKKIMDNPGAGYILFELGKRIKIVDCNDEVYRVFFLKEQSKEKVKITLKNYLSEKDIKHISKLNIGNKFNKSISFNKYGLKHYAEMSFNVLSLKNKDYFLARITDITNDVRKREELELSEKKYRNLYYKNKAGVFTIDNNSVIINGNDAFFEMLEQTLSVGDRLFPASNEKDWELIMESFGEKESSQNYQTQFILNNKVEKTFIFNWYLDTQSYNIEGSVIDLTSIQKASQALRQSEEKYRLIYEESNDAILLLDNDKIIDINRKAIQLFGLPQAKLLGLKLYDLSANKNTYTSEEYNTHIQRLSNTKSVKFNWLFTRTDKVIEGEVTLIEIMLGNKLFYQCVIQDKTEQNTNLRAIKSNQRNLENILENNPEGILIIRDNEVLYRNPEIVSLVGEQFDFETLFTPTDQKKFNKALEVHLENGSRQSIQLKLKTLKDENLLMDITVVPTRYEEEAASLIIMKDVSVQNTLAKEKLRAELAEETNKKLAAEIMERIKTERLLEEQFLRTKAILDSSSNTFLLTLSRNSEITSFNMHSEAYFSLIVGKKIEKGIHFNTYFKTLISPARLRLFNIHFAQVKNGKSKQFEVMMISKENEYWLEIFMNPIFDTEGAVAEISLVAHDISEKKKSSIEIEESLKEKEILLKEIHHRVKNNLQVISSILNLQSSFVQDEKTLEILQESRNRIRSMAIIHENLYRTEDFSSINFSNYFDNLTRSLISSYRIGEEVHLDSELEEIDLILDQAIPCGLLVNELITNALKYAWKEGEAGTISMRLKETDDLITLEISDDGVGLPVPFEKMKSDTLGLQLVETLVEQLDGEIEVNIKNGTKYLIKFENLKRSSNV